MKDGIGEGYTREDHPEVADQIFSAYSRVREVADLAQVIGEDELSETDRKYMEFGRQFEERFIRQKADENRDIIQTLELAWELLAILPEEELNRIKPETLKKYYRK
jgi:V/A-type H+-transporting ATPase subunit B